MRMSRRILWIVFQCAILAWPAAAAEVVRVRVEDTIQPASQRFLSRALAEAATRDADVVVLELDTPGGLLDSTREITSAITGSTVPVVVYVTPAGAQATSAGFFILLSADVTAMAPGTNAGAASPVQGGGQDVDETMKAKVFSDASALARSLAESRGRSTDLAVQAVEDAASFTADEAFEVGLADILADDLGALIEQLDGREIERIDGRAVVFDLENPAIVEIKPSSAEQLLSVLANPNIAYLLMALGMLGIYVEITHPGGILPGVVGVIAILLALYSMSVLPVNLAGVALICVGLLLFFLEVKVTSYGMLTVGGLISFVLGSLMLFDAPIPDMRVSLGVVLPTAALMAVVTGFLLSRVVKLHRQQPLTGVEGLVGEFGEALNELTPDGKVRVHGEYWDARTVGAPVAAGAQVRVVAVVGRRIDVEPSTE